MQAGGNDYLIKTASLDHILARISYWARPTSIWSNEHRREQALAAVKKAVIEEEARGQEQRIELTSKTDDTVRQMSEFVMAAQAQAPMGFGATIEQKLYLLGYVTGVVDHWAKLKLSMRLRYLDYLRSVLKETAILGARQLLGETDLDLEQRTSAGAGARGGEEGSDRGRGTRARTAY